MLAEVGVVLQHSSCAVTTQEWQLSSSNDDSLHCFHPDSHVVSLTKKYRMDLTNCS